MDILCLMGLFPEEYREEIEKNSKSDIEYAANKLQWSIVKGLDSVDDVNVKIANSIYIGSYPKRYKKRIIPTFEFKHSVNAKGDINVGFCNYAGWKFLSKYINTKKVIDKWAQEDSGEEKALLAYALTTPFCQLCGYVKKHYKNIKVGIIVPDLPEFMDTSQKETVRSFLKKLEIKSLRRSVRNVDCFVFLTDAMKQWFKDPVRYIVVEGIAINSSTCSIGVDERKKSIIYAGGVKREYGVVDLVEAFIKVDRSDWMLEIYGGGPALDEIKQIIAGRSNIALKGFVSNSEVVDAQKKASLLVNPRKNQIFTKYSFPSKTLEYMASGTPMLAYKLDGIPDEYDDYYFRIEDCENGFENALKTVMGLSDEERCEMGDKAKNFVNKFKNPTHQAQKIVDLIKSFE